MYENYYNFSFCSQLNDWWETHWAHPSTGLSRGPYQMSKGIVGGREHHLTLHSQAMLLGSPALYKHSLIPNLQSLPEGTSRIHVPSHACINVGRQSPATPSPNLLHNISKVRWGSIGAWNNGFLPDVWIQFKREYTKTKANTWRIIQPKEEKTLQVDLL